ncbi:MAG TPA: DUF2818 family protein [Gammaproteobacteria bacterium]|nr:DUF2818 family protein [Gammaproteobacteria bacterium]
MSQGASIWLLVALAFVAANLPWLSERVAFVFEPPAGGKREWVRLLEWAALFCVVGVAAEGLEYRAQGQLHHQDWEFYVTTICLFVVFALPGFIYHHDLRRHLRRRSRWRS